MAKLLIENDKRFLRKGLKYFGIRMIKIEQSPSTAKYPDIWVSQNGRIPKISITREWARQSPNNRRNRLVHECLHIRGLEHNDKIGYSTYPDKDSFSKKVYLDILSGANKFDRRKFGL